MGIQVQPNCCNRQPWIYLSGGSIARIRNTISSNNPGRQVSESMSGFHSGPLVFLDEANDRCIFSYFKDSVLSEDGPWLDHIYGFATCPLEPVAPITITYEEQHSQFETAAFEYHHPFFPDFENEQLYVWKYHSARPELRRFDFDGSGDITLKTLDLPLSASERMFGQIIHDPNTGSVYYGYNKNLDLENPEWVSILEQLNSDTIFVEPGNWDIPAWHQSSINQHRALRYDIDFTEGYIFSNLSGTLTRCNLDGSDMTILSDEPNTIIAWIGLDLVKKRVLYQSINYASVARQHTLYRAHYDGSNRVRIAGATNRPQIRYS